MGTVAPEPADGAFRPAELACDVGTAVDDERLAPWVYEQLTRRGLVRFAGQTCDALTFGRFARRLRTDTSAAGFRSRMYKVSDEAYGGTSEGPGTPGFVPGFPELMLMGNVPNDALGQGIVRWDESFARPVVDLERLASDIRPHDDSPKQARRSATNGAAHWHTE